MDAIAAAAQGGEQADFSGAVEEGGACLVRQPTQLRQRPIVLGIAHHAQDLHIHKALEKVQQGQLPPLALVKGVLEPIA